MSGRVALVIQLSAGAFTDDDAAALAADGWQVIVVAAETDAASGPALAPMDVMGPADTDAVYAAANAWQRAMPAVRLRSGTALHDLRPWPDAPPVIWSWLNRLYPHVHVQVRLIELMHVAVRRHAPQAWAVVGDSAAFPWQAALAERCMATFLPRARRLLPRPPAAPPPAPETVPATPAGKVARRRITLLGATRWAFRRLRPKPVPPPDPALLLPAEAVPGRSDVALIMRGKRGSQWHFCRARGSWGVRDEYIENVPEALIDACRAAGRTVTIIYHGDPPDTDTERRGYAERHPDVVREVATGPLAGLFRAHRRAAAKRIAPTFHDSYLGDPAFAAAFTHRGVEFWDVLSPFAREHIPNLALAMLAQYEAWRLVFAAIGPATVVGGRMEAVPALTGAAHAAGAHVVSVKLGVGQEMLPSVIAQRPDGTFADECFPNALAVWGDTQTRFLAEHIPGYGGRVVATGRSRSDTFAADTRPRAEVRAALDVPDDVRLVVFAATAQTHYARWPGAKAGACCLSQKGFAAALEALAGIADARTWILVKPHAADDIAAISALVAACDRQEVRLLRPGGPIHNADLLGASDVLVSSLSSIFAEAVLLDCPAVNLWMPEVNFLYEEDRCRLYGRIATTVDTPAAMAAAVRRLLDDPPARAAELARGKASLADIIGPVDGGNARRIAELVVE